MRSMYLTSIASSSTCLWLPAACGFVRQAYNFLHYTWSSASSAYFLSLGIESFKSTAQPSCVLEHPSRRYEHRDVRVVYTCRVSLIGDDQKNMCSRQHRSRQNPGIHMSLVLGLELCTLKLLMSLDRCDDMVSADLQRHQERRGLGSCCRLQLYNGCPPEPPRETLYLFCDKSHIMRPQ